MRNAGFRPMSSRISWSVLEPPIILYQSNHLLVVSKPPGWHSIPNRVDTDSEISVTKDSSSSSKCLVTSLQSQRLGGGSRNDFLKPCHRIDQPCSGVSILAKTQKAASRIQSNWKDVQKTYLVAVEPRDYDGEEILETTYSWRGNHDSNMEWHTLQAKMAKKYSRAKRNKAAKHTNRGWSVTYTPRFSSSDQNDGGSINKNNTKTKPGTSYEIQIRSILRNLLEVRTRQGARHIVRGILSCHGIAVQGDLRYGASRPLPDQSVALHGRSITFSPRLQLGQTPFPRCHVAPIPHTWNDFFEVTEEAVTMNEELHSDHVHAECKTC
jgi:23S rRNA pseudouridine1911/1915/1917 synthase